MTKTVFVFLILYLIWVVRTADERCEDFNLNSKLNNSMKMIGKSNQILITLPDIQITGFS